MGKKRARHASPPSSDDGADYFAEFKDDYEGTGLKALVSAAMPAPPTTGLKTLVSAAIPPGTTPPLPSVAVAPPPPNAAPPPPEKKARRATRQVEDDEEDNVTEDEANDPSLTQRQREERARARRRATISAANETLNFSMVPMAFARQWCEIESEVRGWDENTPVVPLPRLGPVFLNTIVWGYMSCLMMHYAVPPIDYADSIHANCTQAGAVRGKMRLVERRKEDEVAIFSEICRRMLAIPWETLQGD